MKKEETPRKRCRNGTKSVAGTCVKRLVTTTVTIRKEIQDDLTAVADFIWWRQKYSREAVEAGKEVVKEIKRQMTMEGRQ